MWIERDATRDASHCNLPKEKSAASCFSAGPTPPCGRPTPPAGEELSCSQRSWRFSSACLCSLSGGRSDAPPPPPAEKRSERTFAVVCPIGSTTSLPSSLARAHTHTLSLRSGLAQPSLPTHSPRPRFRWLPSSRERCWLLVAVWGQHAFGTRTAHFYTILSSTFHKKRSGLCCVWWGGRERGALSALERVSLRFAFPMLIVFGTISNCCDECSFAVWSVSCVCGVCRLLSPRESTRPGRPPGDPRRGGGGGTEWVPRVLEHLWSTFLRLECSHPSQ